MVALVIQMWVSLIVNLLHRKRSTVRLLCLFFFFFGVCYSLVCRCDWGVPSLSICCLFPPCALAFGWICAKHVHISAVCVFLFSVRVLLVCKFFLMLRNRFNVLWNRWSFFKYLGVHRWCKQRTTIINSGCLEQRFPWSFFLAFVATEIVVPLQVCTVFLCYKIFSFTFLFFFTSRTP